MEFLSKLEIQSSMLAIELDVLRDKPIRAKLVVKMAPLAIQY